VGGLRDGDELMAHRLTGQAVDRGRTARGGPRLSLWPPLPVAATVASPNRMLPFPFDAPNCRVYHRARQGIWHGVRALGLQPGNEVIAPAYHQGSGIEALVRAGLVVRFYDTDDLLAPEPERLEALLGPRTRALYVIHFWGFPQDAARWRAWCDERGLLLVEDAAQALFAATGGHLVGSLADLSVFCIYKTFGVPDGAAAACRSELPAPSSRADVGLPALARRAGSALAQRSAWFAGLHRRLAGDVESDRPFGEFLPGEFELGDPLRPPSRLASLLLRRVVDPSAPERRRRNYAHLLERLRDHAPAAFRTLPDGASPFAFPIEAGDPRSLARALEAGGIDSGRLWPSWHPSLPVESFPVARHYRERVLGVPVHQALTEPALDRIADAVLGHEGRRG
jgi:dTDP-4-amino-4,6-dideoxygalactose transaminase